MKQELVHEDLYSALRFVIDATGGPKAIGMALWPTLTPDAAGRKLGDCLNVERAQQLHIDEMLWILKEARRKGVHAGMAFISKDIGYAAPTPLDPRDEAEELQRLYIQSVEAQKQIIERMERLTAPEMRLVKTA